MCAGQHNAKECTAHERRCLCKKSHAADDINCPPRAQEMQIIEIVQQKRCSRHEARIIIVERSRGYASATRRINQAIDSSIPQAIPSTIERSMAKAIENLFVTFTESLAQIVNAQMTQMLQSVIQPGMTSLPSSPPKELNARSIESPSTVTTRKEIIPVHEELYFPDNMNRKLIIPGEQDFDWSSDSSSHESQMDSESRNIKLRALPLTQGSPVNHNIKSKKYQEKSASKKDFLKDSILEKAVHNPGISSK